MKKYPLKKEGAKGHKWSDGWANTKNGKTKAAKPGKNDDVELDGVTLVDEDAEVRSITGGKVFILGGVSLIIKGKKNG